MSWLPWVRKRRRELRATPLDAESRAIVDRNVPLVRLLTPAERAKLEGDVQVFLAEKTFEGCGGLDLTDEIRVTIAAQACLLIVAHDVAGPYPGLDVLRVYPGAYRARVAERALTGVVVEGHSHRLGESSTRGYLVLSWDDARRGGARIDGDNVVLHEFAHQLDTRDGVADGAPPLAEPSHYGPWAEALGSAYEQLRADLADHLPTTLDPYGATNPAEFFAVATEAFFEHPVRLSREEPALYAALARYYGLDLASRATGG